MNTHRLASALTVINLILLIVLAIQSQTIATQRVPDVLRVQAFELVDGHGHVRAQLNIDETTGEVIFRLRDENENIRVKLGASEEGSGLLLINNLTEPGVHLVAKQDDTSLTLRNQGGEKQVIEP